MEIAILLQGMIIGFSIAAPVGPIGLLCIRRTLTEGRVAGLLSGLGAATADTIYGGIAGFGLTYAANVLTSQQLGLSLGGGIFLCYLGLRTFLSKPAERAASISTRGLAAAYISTLLLTLANPLTILSFAAVFAGLGVTVAAGSYFTAALLVGGVFLGSAAWWLILSSLVSRLRTRVKSDQLKWINRLSGLVIMIFGLVVLFEIKI